MNKTRIKFQTNNKQINFAKYENALIPAIIQHYKTKTVLMLGFMNQQAFDKTLEIGKVTFYSRSKKRLWTKGETSGNFLELKEVTVDCDNDTLLFKVDPKGHVCHLGNDTCFGNLTAEDKKPIKTNNNLSFLLDLEETILSKKNSQDKKSYTYQLFLEGKNKIAQKVGEESTEVVIEAVKSDFEKDLFLNETADLLFHLLVLLKFNNLSLSDVIDVLKKRQK